MTLESLLEHTIYKYILASSQNELGEWVLSQSSLGSAIKARVMPISDEERMTYAGKYPNAEYKIYVSYSESIMPGDRIFHNGNDYLVNEVLWDSSYTYKKLVVSRI